MNTVDLSLEGKRIGLVDADMLDTYSSNQSKRIPNLALMKLSGYFKTKNQVELVEDYANIRDDNDNDKYDVLFIAKVFTKVKVPQEVLDLPYVVKGGTGFFYDQAEPLPDVVEHHRPDYTLYVAWADKQLKQGEKPDNMSVYKDHSVGFTTRGCFRKCAFCVNRNSKKVEAHSPVSEFYDPSKKYITLLDDNILGCASWEKILTDLKETGKKFAYRQGMDIRLMTDAKAMLLGECKHYGDEIIFAFDNLADKQQITKGLTIWRKHVTKRTKLYLLVAFDRNGKWDDTFYADDIASTFERIMINNSFDCLSYIMRYEAWERAPEPYKGMYINIKRWCNMPSLFKRQSFRQFCETSGGKTLETMKVFESRYPATAEKYFDISWLNTHPLPPKKEKQAEEVKVNESETLFE
jgi:hypothetical protein